jgi:hypothetical protein
MAARSSQRQRLGRAIWAPVAGCVPRAVNVAEKPVNVASGVSSKASPVSFVKSLPLGASCSHARRCCASSSRQAREEQCGSLCPSKGDRKQRIGTLGTRAPTRGVIGRLWIGGNVGQGSKASKRRSVGERF